MDIRQMTAGDIPTLQAAIDNAIHHSGYWEVGDFVSTESKPRVANVIEDKDGPIAFTRYTKTLRLCCVWNDEADVHRNSRAIIFGIKDVVERARASGFSEIIIQTSNPKLEAFFTQVLKMKKSDGEFIKYV
jgi:hypothetical protein